MELNRVIGEVAARHGIRLDPDDPALILVTVAELMLQQAQEEFLATTRLATAEYAEAAARAQKHACAFLAEDVRRSGASLSVQFGPCNLRADNSPGARSLVEVELRDSGLVRRVALAASINVLVFLAGIVVGRWFLS